MEPTIGALALPEQSQAVKSRISFDSPDAMPYLADDSVMRFEYVAVLASLVVAAIVPSLFLLVSWALGPRRPSVVKGEAFECGNPPTGSAWGRFSVKFYLTAILFIVFDVEVVFLYPWAIEFRSLGMVGFVEMLLFVGILALGLAYVWRKGALEWE
jgi:NADH-quinone oxidoreductase subunit A